MDFREVSALEYRGVRVPFLQLEVFFWGGRHNPQKAHLAEGSTACLEHIGALGFP